MTVDIRRRSIDTIRVLAMDGVQQANAGHPGTAMALAPLAYTIYRRYLKASPASPTWPDRDRFVLSAGHACILQYATLHLAGYDLPLEELKRFRQWGSKTPGHPEYGLTPGVEATTGPLGQGVSNAVGMAMAERFLAERYNRPGHTVVDHRVFVIASDGDLMEGVSQEAASIAGQFGLGKLIVCWDDNRITIDGSTAISFSREDQELRYEANGWHVQRVEDVNDVEALEAALDAAVAETSRPSFIAVRSHIAYPAPRAMDTAKSHGAPLGPDEVKRTKEVLGWDPESTFAVPEGVYEHMSLVEEGRARQDAWEQAFAAWSEAHPQLREDWDRAFSGKPDPAFAAALPVFGEGKLATRSAGQKVMHAFARHVPTMIGGAADLVESTKTDFPGGGLFSDVHAGRNIPFGIRENAMGSIVNGLAVHGGIVKPYGSTFLVFSDYMRPAVRLSALNHLPVVWVWTHDSIGLGEDGPTHQPVEHFMALRAIPNLWVIRPADANETSIAWKVALEREDGPVALLLSRQDLPVLVQGDGSPYAPASGLERGAYVLREPEGGPELILISTGAEVHVALRAADALAERGRRARVVSMPCMELFNAQDRAYRDEVLPPSVTARVAIEPGTTLGWERWVGERGAIVGLDRFGASAPGTTVLDELGFTPDTVVDVALALLGGA
ncbi:MAG: transketolase [Thermoleophilia bacterium]